MMRTTTFLLLFVSVFSKTNAQSPVADSLFANNSLLTHGIGAAYDGGYLVEQTDGMIILGSHHYTAGFFEAFIDLTRFDVCGRIDSTFGVNGIASVHFDNINTLNAIKLQNDGKILVAGTQAPSTAGSQQLPYLGRLNADGSIDSTFNGTGSHTRRFDNISSGVFCNINILPDGRILATGLCGANINGGQYALGAMQFNTDGTLDTTFNGDGIFTYQSVQLPLNHSNGHLLSNGNAVLTGHQDDQIGHHFIISILLDASGNMVNTYGTSGLYTDPTSYTNAAVNYNTIDNNDNLLTVAQTSSGYRVSRILPTGVIDNSFATSGFADIPSSIQFTPQRINYLPNGKMQLPGYNFSSSDGVLQLNSDGSVDSTFGMNGIISTQVPTSTLGVKGVLRLANNRLMVGFATSNQSYVKKFVLFSNVPHISDNGTNLISTGGGLFQWFLNGGLINGATQNTYIYTQNGSYTTMITDVDGCTYMSDPYVVSSVGITEMNADGISVYPNPASETIIVTSKEKAESLPEIYNSTGQKSECTISKEGKEFYIDVKNFSPGVYFMIIHSEEKMVRKSFVKK